jgi:alpha/beta superfamily hydrolase
MNIPDDSDVCELLDVADQSATTRPLRGTCRTKPPGQMHPVAFDGCFGWLHYPAQSIMSDTAALICPGLHHDASTGHRPFRILAELLAGEGYPVLRFDYIGTGDSSDEADSDECLARWQRSVHAAADWLRQSAGAARIVMVGLRFGAVLASLGASARDDVVGLMLIEPVLRGKSYINQLSMEARLRPQYVALSDDGLELDELHLNGETVRLIRQLELKQIKLPSDCSVSMFSQRQSSVLLACVQTWRDAGWQVAVEGFTGLEALLRPPHLADEPCGAFTPVLTWLRDILPARKVGSEPICLAPQTNRVPHDRCIETPVRFGPNRHLFGMLCQPSRTMPHDLAVVIGNTGGHSHHGYARFGVEFARRLASTGIASLRIDFAGLGDSANPVGSNTDSTHAFGVDRNPDFRAAIDALEQMGYRQFAVNGLCSGAYHALRAALADTRVSVLLPVNLPWFTLRYEKPGPMSFARTAMVILSSRRVRTLLLFADGDAGLKMLERHFGPNGNELAVSSDTILSIDAGIDHNLTGRVMRQIAGDRMIDFLRQGQVVRELSIFGDDGASRDVIASPFSPGV